MPIIKQLYATFHTLDDDKDNGDGISESYVKDGGEIIGQSASWGKGLTFRNDSQNVGKYCDVSGRNIDISSVGCVQYRFDMDTNDGWNVVIGIRAICDDGNVYNVGDQLWNIGNGNHRDGAMYLRPPQKAK